MVSDIATTSAQGAIKTETRIAVAAVFLATTIFAVDLNLPLGVAGGVPYVALVLLGLWSARLRSTLILAGIGTVLTALGHIYSDPAGIPWMVATNRSLAYFAIWTVAATVILRKRSENEVQKINAELEQRVRDRTTDLVEVNINLRKEITERKQVEETLAEKSGLLEAIFETMNQGITVHDADHRLVAFNQKFADLLDLPPGFIRTGMPFEEIARVLAEQGEYGPGDIEELVCERVGALDRGEINPRERTRPNGTVISARRDPMPGGGYVTTYTDITERKKAEEAVRESEAKFRAVVDNSPTKIHIKDAEGRYTLVNPLAEKLFGFTDEEARGKTSYDIFPKEVADAFTAHDRQVAESREMAEQVEHFTLEDGEHTYLTVKFPIFDGQGEVAGVAAIGTDITERKRTEEALARLTRQNELILNSAGEGIYGLDLEGHTTFINPAAAKMIGWELEELFGKPQHAILHHTKSDGSPYPREECPIYAAFMDGTVHHVDDEVFWRKDGTSFPVEYISTPIRDENGELTGAVVIFRDITDRKEAEEALKESEHALQERVVTLEETQQRLERQSEDLIRLAGDLKTARDEAAAANRTKSEFLANMSHELRTPLNAILGFSELMGNATHGPLGNPKYEEYTKDINDSGRHLLALIQDILDLSKIEAGKLELDEEDIDVARTIGSCMVLVKERARNGGVKLKTDIPDGLPTLNADQRKLKQILVNLLSNAVKFTPAGGTVTIKAWCKADAGYVFQVIDTGIGMALADIPKALSPFGQVDSQLDRKYEGTGLGLPLTKSLVEMHGGSLDLQSEEGAGTTVTVRFPSERIVHVSEIEATGTPGA